MTLQLDKLRPYIYNPLTIMGAERKDITPGDEARAAVMHPGEQFLGNWSLPIYDESMLMPSGDRTVHQEVAILRETGRYASVRTIPAFNSTGQELGGMAGIVATPKPKDEQSKPAIRESASHQPGGDASEPFHGREGSFRG
jgi:hypothetical protein